MFFKTQYEVLSKSRSREGEDNYGKHSPHQTLLHTNNFLFVYF